MSTIRVTCPQCKGSGPAPEAFFGIVVKCPRCGTVYTVDETVATRPESAMPTPTSPDGPEASEELPPPPPPKRSGLPLIPIVIGVVVVLGLGAVAAFVYPGFLKSQTPPPDQNTMMMPTQSPMPQMESTASPPPEQASPGGAPPATNGATPGNPTQSPQPPAVPQAPTKFNTPPAAPNTTTTPPATPPTTGAPQ
jgi:hypothetical protein